MDFGEILDAWEDGQGRLKRKKQKSQRKLMERLLEEYLPEKQDFREKRESPGPEDKPAKRRRLREMAPQQELDLHGYTLREALVALENFLKVCHRQQLQKVLIIHGKGNHSSTGPVLQKKILQYIQASPLAGEYGFADKNRGGRGALWVILR